MILFVNVIITNYRRFGFRYNRYGLPSSNRLDIFKYSLASLSALNKLLSKVVIYCHLDGSYKNRWDELETWIRQLFPENKLSLYSHRNWLTPHWREAYQRDIAGVDDRFIWFTANDDHIFIDYNLDMLERILEIMSTDPCPNLSCYYSHWPEIIRYSGSGHPRFAGDAAWFIWNNHDAIQIVDKHVFHRWWHKWDWGQRNTTRSDFMKGTVNYPLKCYVPFREMVRHFDGYSHAIHMPGLCPPLAIPPGFFENNMKIAYCHPTGLEPRRRFKGEAGWIDMHPIRPYRTVMRNGSDCKYTLEDMPLFWRNRISAIESIEPPPHPILIRHRNVDTHRIVLPRYKIAGAFLKPLPEHWMYKWMYRPVSDTPSLL